MSPSIQRRRLLQWLSWGSAGAIAPAIRPDWERRREEKDGESQPIPATNVLLEPFSFETVTVNDLGQTIDSQRRSAVQFTEKLNSYTSLEMVWVPRGTLRMGSPESEAGRFQDEGPLQDVTLSPFFLSKFPVTQSQWRAVATLPQVARHLKFDPSRFQAPDRPVERITWYEAVEFCDRLSRWSGRHYRLPSEAEWEYACRAVSPLARGSQGSYPPFHFGATITADLANYNSDYTYAQAPKGKYRKQTTPVGSFPANTFGLYDLHGNVWEWCADHWRDSYIGTPKDGSPWRDPRADLIPTPCIMRGGAWSALPYLVC